VALLLRNRGVKRIRPLLGGLQAWRDRGYPLETISTIAERSSNFEIRG
jgi:3-mercaptopyruvate sulfurtransferase SseA